MKDRQIFNADFCILFNLLFILCCPTCVPPFYLLIISGYGVTKRCRLSLPTNSALGFESQCGGGGCGVSANEYSCAHHVTWSPNKLWISISIFNLCCRVGDVARFLCSPGHVMEGPPLTTCQEDAGWSTKARPRPIPPLPYTPTWPIYFVLVVFTLRVMNE